MQDQERRITELGAQVVFVAFDEPEALRSQLLEGVELAFPFLVDRERRAYRAWGMERAPWWRIWLDPKVWWQYARLLASGEALREGGADPLQLGGDFVVAPDGTLAYARPQVRDDRPPVGKLLAVVRGLREREGG